MKLSNRYFILRHGEALSNVKNIISSWPEKGRFGLTKKGKKQIEESAKHLKNKNIDFIFSSDLLRTKQTAEIAEKFLKIKPVFDKRLREYSFGVYNGRPMEEFAGIFNSQIKRFSIKPEKGENYKEITKRMQDFLKDLEKKYKNKNILIISHQVPIILLLGKVEGLKEKQISEKYLKKDRIKNGEIRQF